MANAPGQMQGYTLQLQRALLYLLQGGPGTSVCVEVIGDVGQTSASGITAEEDKSSLSSNPVTDKSSDLWKTFYNWIQMIDQGVIEPSNTQFVLYTNHAGQAGIVYKLNDAQTSEGIEHCVKNAAELFQSIADGHPIHNYLSHILGHAEQFKRIISKFSFFVGSQTGSQEVRDALTTMVLPEGQIEHIHEELLGWVTNRIMDLIASKKDPIISWDEYQGRARVIFERARNRELIDFTRELSEDELNVQGQIKDYPYYLQQLGLIGIDDEGKVRAVSDFLRAKINLDKWIEDGLLDENLAVEFEEKLRRFWANSRTRVGLTHKNEDKETRGVIVFTECMDRQETIRNQNLPPATIPGTYHNMANDDAIGWHEEWKSLLKK